MLSGDGDAVFGRSILTKAQRDQDRGEPIDDGQTSERTSSAAADVVERSRQNRLRQKWGPKWPPRSWP